MTPRSGNIGRTEQLMSIAAGIGLMLTAVLRRGTPVGRLAATTAALSLLARGATGYCAVRGSLAGQSSLRDGFREQWNRMRAGLSPGAMQEIDSLHSLYIAELQELHSAEAQLCSLLEEMAPTLQNLALARQLEGYATEVSSRGQDLAGILRKHGANPRAHSDQAMAALLLETRKVAHLSEPAIRQAALLASLQRVIHFKIAGYGTVATYAKMPGFTDEAARLAQYGDRDKEFDTELSQTAQGSVNPQARAANASGDSTAEPAASPAH
jgi:ferritin-like metal-binding protein YciE